jgi:hypothetical protein
MESIAGDLLEEFSDLALKSGVASARRWYWHQCAKTIAHLIASGFRFAPWRIAAVVLIGRWLLPYGLMLPEKTIVAFLRWHPIFPNYDHENVYKLWMFWVPLAIQIGWVIVPLLIGCLVAVAVKGREMLATMTLGLTLVAPLLVRMIVDRPGTPFSGPPFLRVAIFTVFPVAAVVGGVIVRKIRMGRVTSAL